MKSKVKLISGLKDWNRDYEKLIPKGASAAKSMHGVIPDEMGLYIDEKGYYHTSGYVGVGWLKDYQGKTMVDPVSGEKIALMIIPRFSLNPWEMLIKVMNDPEYELYVSGSNGNFFEVHTSEELVPVPNTETGGELLAAISFVKECEKICKKHLRQAMDFKEENFNGKIVGNIQVAKHIKQNVSQAREDRIFCKYPIFTVDTLENRIMKAALIKAKKVLRNDFLEYSAALEHAKAAELVDTFNRILNEQLEVINSENQEEENSSRFNVRAKINEFLKEPFNRYLAQTLSECKYENLTGSRFDENICDVVVGGSEKMSQGKGFRAFLNTVLALVVQETMNEYNMFQPHLLVLDSPILSLKEREETTGTEVTTDGMRSGLFKYMISHEENRQTIILENEIPNIDYSGVHMIHFTKKEGDEMYGLIKGYRD